MNDKTAQRFGEVFRRFFETGYMDDLAELFQGESKVIVYLSTAEGIVYPSDISRDLMISRQRATSVLSAMEKKGFVSLVRDPEDKRRVQVKLLPKGEKSIEETSSATVASAFAFSSALAFSSASLRASGPCYS